MPKGLFSATETIQPTPLRYPKSTSFMWLAECLGLDGRVRVGSPIIFSPYRSARGNGFQAQSSNMMHGDHDWKTTLALNTRGPGSAKSQTCGMPILDSRAGGGWYKRPHPLALIDC